MGFLIRQWGFKFGTPVAFAAVLALTALVYAPSLSGGFVFDDVPNIVDNPQVHMSDLSWHSIKEAALASPAKELIRPLAMLSFALDWYVTDGSSAHQMRVVNLAIHLLNGLLVFWLVRVVCEFSQAEIPDAKTSTANKRLLALLVSTTWLLAPINFTAVAYIVQRMESLCQIFVLAGLIFYVKERMRVREGRGSLWRCAVILILFTGLGLSAKESAALLPLYALTIDAVITGFVDKSSRIDRRSIAMYGTILLLPGCIALTWALHRYLPAEAWRDRPFSLSSRLLTEPRILVDYIQWTLFPRPDALALFHDTINPSESPVTPPTTIFSSMFLIGSGVAGWSLRKQYPLACIGILWFLAAHLLTATIIPLELVFEHRNYFASVGILLAVVSTGMSIRTLPVARVCAIAALILLFILVGSLRSLEWGNPVSFATTEAAKNPNSPRTLFELGRTYVSLSNFDADSPYTGKAFDALNAAANMPNSDALADQALIVFSADLHQTVPSEAWMRLGEKLTTQPLSVGNISALYGITGCVLKKICSIDHEALIALFDKLIMENPRDVRLLSIYSNYSANELHDIAKAIALMEKAVAADPNNLTLRINILILLTTDGREKDAADYYRRILLAVPGAESDEVLQQWGTRLQMHKMG